MSATTPCEADAEAALRVFRSFGPMDLHAALRPAGRQCVLDLRTAEFVFPAGLVALAVIAEQLVGEGAEVRLRRPDDPNVARYIARTRLGPVLDDLGVNHDLPHVREHRVGDALLELRSFNSAEEMEVLADLVHRKASRQKPAIAENLYRAIAEAGQNVGQHSGQSRGFLVAQSFPRKQRLDFAVGDAGIGFLGALAGRGATDDGSALELALQPGVSSVDDSGRGWGLSAIAGSLRALGGVTHLHSGRAHLVHNAAGARVLAYDSPLPGSIVSGMLRI